MISILKIKNQGITILKKFKTALFFTLALTILSLILSLVLNIKSWDFLSWVNRWSSSSHKETLNLDVSASMMGNRISLNSREKYATRLFVKLSQETKAEQPGNSIKEQKILFFEKEILFGSEQQNGSEGLFSYIKGIEFDSNENLFVLDLKHQSILNFDPSGMFQKTIGKAGEGPGDMLSPVSLFSSQSNIFVFDINLRRVSQFDFSGTVKNTAKIDEFIISDFFIDHEMNFYAVCKEISESGIVDTLFKIDPKGKKKVRVAEFFRENFDKKTGGVFGGVTHVYSPRIYLTKVDVQRFAFVNNLEPKIYIVDTTQNSVDTVVFDEKDEPITSEEVDYFKKSFRQDPDSLKLPPCRPFYKRIFSDENGTIFAVRFKPILDKKSDWKIDVISKMGRLVCRYSSPYEPFSIHRGKFYTVGKDSNDEVIIKKIGIKNPGFAPGNIALVFPRK